MQQWTAQEDDEKNGGRGREVDIISCSLHTLSIRLPPSAAAFFFYFYFCGPAAILCCGNF